MITEIDTYPPDGYTRSVTCRFCRTKFFEHFTYDERISECDDCTNKAGGKFHIVNIYAKNEKTKMSIDSFMWVFHSILLNRHVLVEKFSRDAERNSVATIIKKEALRRFSTDDETKDYTSKDCHIVHIRYYEKRAMGNLRPVSNWDFIIKKELLVEGYMF